MIDSLIIIWSMVAVGMAALIYFKIQDNRISKHKEAEQSQ